MSAVAQLAEFLAAAWLLWRVTDRCYRGRVPRDLRTLEDARPGPAEPRLREPGPGASAAHRL